MGWPVPVEGRMGRHGFLTTLVIGFGAGLLNAMIGVGGGILLVPGLILIRKLTPRVAVSTSLGSVLILSSAALATHLTVSPFHLSTGGAGLLLVSGAAGSQIGGFLLNRIAMRWVLFTFAGLTLVSASHLAATALNWLPPMSANLVEPHLWTYGVLGVCAGICSGLLGIGGGTVVILGFSVIFRTPLATILPIAQASNVLNALSGVLAQRRTGNVQWGQVFALVPSGLLGVAVGQAAALLLPPDTLRLLFAGFFITMSISLIRRGLHMGVADPSGKP